MMRVSFPRSLLVAALVVLVSCGPHFCGAQIAFTLEFHYGFYPDAVVPTVDPTTPQLDALVCETQIFFSQVLQNYTGNPNVTMEARDISFVKFLDQNNETQMSLTFWANFNTVPGGNIPRDSQISVAFDIEANPNIDGEDLLLNHVQPATPLNGDNPYFKEVNRLTYNGTFGLIQPGDLPTATCRITIAPTFDANANGTNKDDGPNRNTDFDLDFSLGSPPDPNGTNLDDYVLFTHKLGFEEGTARNFTEQEVLDLICKTNLFYTDLLRNVTGDNTIHFEAANIDWSYNESSVQPITITFIGNVTSNDYQDPVPPETVLEATQIGQPAIITYIELYLWTTKEESVFGNVDSASVDNGLDVPIPIGRLEMHKCPTTDAPSMAPTMSAAPTSSKAPSMAPSVSAAPSSSKAPSTMPSISPAPSTESFTSGTGQRPIPETPSISPMPTVSPAPTNSPTISAAPTISPGPTSVAEGGRPTTPTPISVKYYASNTDNLFSAFGVEYGLSEAWPAFASEVVANITSARDRRMLKAGGRRLTVGLEPNSATIDLVEEVDCPEESIDGATCHNVTSSYILLLTGDEDPAVVEQEYGPATMDAVDDGRYQAVLDQVEPESPYTIGIIPKGKSDGGDLPLWLTLLIILLCVLCCCCILLSLFYFIQNQDKEPYQEDFVYDFFIPRNDKYQTEVDDDTTRAADWDSSDTDNDDTSRDQDLQDKAPDKNQEQMKDGRALNVAAPEQSLALIEEAPEQPLALVVVDRMDDEDSKDDRGELALVPFAYEEGFEQ